MAPELHLEKMQQLKNRAKEEKLNPTNEKEVIIPHVTKSKTSIFCIFYSISFHELLIYFTERPVNLQKSSRRWHRWFRKYVEEENQKKG